MKDLNFYVSQKLLYSPQIEEETQVARLTQSVGDAYEVDVRGANIVGILFYNTPKFSFNNFWLGSESS